MPQTPPSHGLTHREPAHCCEAPHSKSLLQENYSCHRRPVSTFSNFTNDLSDGVNLNNLDEMDEHQVPWAKIGLVSTNEKRRATYCVHCGPQPVMVSGLGKNPGRQRQMAIPSGLTLQSVLGPQG